MSDNLVECKKCKSTVHIHDTLSGYCLGCADDLIAQVTTLQAKLKKAEEENQSFGNVLAVIHRDGGHYITEHGHQKASKDAIRIIIELREELAKTGKCDTCGKPIKTDCPRCTKLWES